MTDGRVLSTGSVADLDAVLALLDESWSRVRARGVDRQRVDCYAGDDGKLVRFYVSAGFTPPERFEVNGWPGQLLERSA